MSTRGPTKEWKDRWESISRSWCVGFKFLIFFRETIGPSKGARPTTFAKEKVGLDSNEVFLENRCHDTKYQQNTGDLQYGGNRVVQTWGEGKIESGFRWV